MSWCLLVGGSGGGCRSDVCFVLMVLSLLPAGGSGGGCRFGRLLCRGVKFVACGSGGGLLVPISVHLFRFEQMNSVDLQRDQYACTRHAHDRRNVKETKQNERGGGGGGGANGDFVNIYVNKMEEDIHQCNILAMA